MRVCYVCREKVAPGCFMRIQDANSCYMSFVPDTGPSLHLPPFIPVVSLLPLEPFSYLFFLSQSLCLSHFFPTHWLLHSPLILFFSLNLPCSEILPLFAFLLSLLPFAPLSFTLYVIFSTFMSPSFTPLTPSLSPPSHAFFSSLVSSLVPEERRHVQGRKVYSLVGQWAGVAALPASSRWWSAVCGPRVCFCESWMRWGNKAGVKMTPYLVMYCWAT